MLTHECKGNASYKHLSIKQENIDLYYKNKPRIFATVPYNSLNSNKIIALARIPSIEKTSEWKQFELPFEYKKAIDESALKEGKYKLAVVFSSSINGAEFKGSVGSTLWIDEVTIQCKEDNE